MIDLIQKYVEAYGPSAYEDAIRAMIIADAKQYTADVTTDALGNVIARVAGKKGGQRVMLIAHMDEIGVMVSHIDANGFCRLMRIGGVNPQTLIGNRVQFTNGVMGVIGVDNPGKRSLPSYDDLFIDVGASSKADCPVGLGDVAGFVRPFLQLNENRLVAKSMDDRIGCVVLLETLKALKNPANEVIFVWSVQEEVGTRGAGPAAYHTEPDIVIAVDVTATSDTPKGFKMDVDLGKGPAIKVRDGGMLADPRLVRLMRDQAVAASLPYQMEILPFGTTDARATQVTRGGIPSGCLSIPCRYIHTPSEMVDLRDVQNGVKLLTKVVSEAATLK